MHQHNVEIYYVELKDCQSVTFKTAEKHCTSPGKQYFAYLISVHYEFDISNERNVFFLLTAVLILLVAIVIVDNGDLIFTDLLLKLIYFFVFSLCALMPMSHWACAGHKLYAFIIIKRFHSRAWILIKMF